MARFAGDGGITASGLNPHGMDADQSEGANQDPLSFGGSVGRGYTDAQGRYHQLQESAATGLARDARRLAEEADRRAGPALDFGRYDQARAAAGQARGEELYGLSALRNAATGGAPSAAMLGGRVAGDQALQAQLAQQAGRGGLGASLAANTSGAYGMAGASQQAGSGLAGEMASSRGQFHGLAGNIRTGDFGAAQQAASREKLAADVEARQRALNASREGFYTSQEIATNKAAQQAGSARQNLALDNWSAAAQYTLAQREKKAKEDADAYGTMASAAGAVAAAASDERVKRDIEYVGTPAPIEIPVQEVASPPRRTAAIELPVQESAAPPRPGGKSVRGLMSWADREIERYGALGASGASVGGERPSAAQELARTVRPVAYNYKLGEAEDPRRRRYGVLAQDLELSPMGKSLVHDTPNGKVVDTRHAALASLAVGADLQRQIDRMKAGEGPKLFSEEQIARYAAAEREAHPYGDPAVAIGRTSERAAPEGYRARGGPGRMFGPPEVESFDKRHGLAPGSGDFYRTEDIDEQRARRERA